MLYRSPRPTSSVFQGPIASYSYSSSMRDVDAMPNMNLPTRAGPMPLAMPMNLPLGPGPAAVMPVPTPVPSTNLTASPPSCHPQPAPTQTNWRQGTDDLRRLRSRVVVLIERMLRNHQPHDVLTQVPENTNWRSKTFVLALKIERLMFLAAPSKENYLNEQTLRSRVQLLSRHLVRIRKRKNAVASMLAPSA